MPADSRVDDLTAARLAEKIRQAYPHMKGGDVLSLARAGYGPDSGPAKEIARRRAKKKSGFGLHTLGDIGRGVVRTGFTMLEAPLQEVQGGLRAIASAAGEAAEEGEAITGIWSRLGDAYDRAGASTARIAARDLIRTGEVDLGTGFFSGGEVGREQARQSRQLTFAGEPISTGRLVAYAVSEPGSQPYRYVSGLIDAAVAIGLDPVNVAGGSLAKVAKARKTFAGSAELAPNLRRMGEAAGLVHGVRRTVIPEAVEGWLAGDGRKVVDYLAGEDNLRRMWRTTGKKLPVDLMIGLRDASSPDEVMNLLRPVLGTTIREKPELPGWVGAQFRRVTTPRLAYSMPGDNLDLGNHSDVVEQMERFMKNARLDEADIDRHTEAIARATQQGSTPVYGAVESVMKDVATRIGGDPKVGRKATKMFRDYHADLAKYAVDGEIGLNLPVLGAQLNGANQVLPTPHLFVEYLNRNLPLPDARTIRRLTANDKIKRLVNSPGWDYSVAATDFVFGSMWKPLTLLRGAWTVRVVGEEQARMGASGLDSVFAHPLSAISWAVGRERAPVTGVKPLTRAARRGGDVARKAGRAGRGDRDVFGAVFKDLTELADDVDQFTQALSRRGGGWIDRQIKLGRVNYARGDDEFARSLAQELQKLRSDPIARRVAGGWSENDLVPGGFTGNHVEDAKRWFWEGPGKKFRLDMAQSPGREPLATMEGASAYIDEVFGFRIQNTTRGDQRLLDLVVKGKLDDVPLSDGLKTNDDIVARLAALSDEGVGPDIVPGDLTLVARQTAGGRTAEMMNRAVEHMFNDLMSRPTNKLSRSPAFRQYYWKRVEELLPFVDEATQDAMILAAGEAKLSRPTLRRMARIRLRGQGDLDLEDADTIAKGWALDKTRELLYDLSERKQFFDVARHVFPFGEAWLEMLTRWSKIGTENPASLRKVQQTVEGARGAGWFYTDPTTGEEVFNYPGTDLVSQWMFDVNAPMQGRVAGLSLMTEVVPGVGPVVQLPASKVIPNKPEWDWVRDIVLPFGDPRSGPIPGVAAPPWLDKLQKFNDTPESDRLFANTTFDVAKALVASGDYSMSSPDEMTRTLARAQTVARGMYVVRGMAQFFAPSAPSPEIKVQDKDGSWHLLAALTTEFQRYQQQDYDTAVERFVGDFGSQLSLVMQSRSRGGAPPVEGIGDFVRRHPEIRERFPKSYGYFAPDVGDFDFDLYDLQIRSGEREALSPKEAAELANSRIAGTYWRKAKEAVGPKPTDAQKIVLRKLKEHLLGRYPGWKPEAFDKSRIPTLIRELEDAAVDERLANTEAAKGIRLYLKARQAASRGAVAAGLEPTGWQSALRMADSRAVLRQVAVVLTQRYPEFGRVFDEVFDREMVEDAQEEAA